jgi:branched-chain amino acid transport system ATP-binding protein
MRASTDILLARKVTASYGLSQVLFGVDFAIAAGTVTTLLGRNGMGKTTTVRAILGQVASVSEQLEFRGASLAKLPTYRIARLGIGLVPEGRQIFPNLTVEENLLALAANRCGTADPWSLKRIYQLFPRLAERRSNMGNQLSGGELQMLAIGRALMTNPYLLILDEATEGLAPLIREEIWNCLKALRSMNQSILLIDKNIEQVLEISDHNYILEKGQVVWHGSSAELASNEAIRNTYLAL